MENTENGIQKKCVPNFAKIQKSEYSAFHRPLICSSLFLSVAKYYSSASFVKQICKSRFPKKSIHELI